MTAKPKTRRKEAARPRRSLIGTALQTKFMEPLGITYEQLCVAFPPDHRDLRWMFEYPEADLLIIVSVARAMDRVLGLPNGHVLKLWADCGARARSKHLKWLKEVKPIGLDARRHKFAELGGSTPGLADIPSANQKSGRRKRVLLPAFKAMMSEPQGADVHSALKEDRSR